MSVVALALATTLRVGTVVMVHGAGGGGWEYDFWKPVWARAGWKVVARDLLPVRSGLAKTTVEDYKAQLVTWCRGARRPLVMVGASMGGGLTLAVNDVVRPDAIVLIGSVAPAGIGEPKSPAYPQVVRWANGPLRDTVIAMPDSDEKTQRRAWKRWRDESGQVLRALAKGVPAKAPKCPVLVIWGANDTDVPLDTGYRIATAYSADFKVYDDTSHVGPLMGKRARAIAGEALSWVGQQIERKR